MNTLSQNALLNKSVTRSYIVALLLIGLLSVTAFLLLGRTIDSQKNMARVINLSGRQRMLSQRVSLSCEHLVHGREKDRTQAVARLPELISTFEVVHAQLVKTEVEAVRALYLGSAEHLDADAKVFARKALDLFSKFERGEDVTEGLEELRDLQNVLLPKLDAAVLLNQEHAEAQVLRLKDLELLVLTVTLVLLLFEVLYIFRPMVRTINHLFGAVNEARELALQATDEKSSFLAIVTHEVRSPLIGVIGITDALLEKGVPDGRYENIKTIQRLSQSLLTMINDLLDYSKIEAGQFSLEEIEFAPAVLAADAKALFYNAAEAKHIALDFDIDGDLPMALLGDPTRLRQVITNFVGNSLKFTPEKGTIGLRVSAVSEGDGTSLLRVEVTDTGVGISEAAQARLFNRYVQADASVNRKFGGSGLGLFISKQIITAMGGEIGVKSREGEDSMFWFEVPLKAGQKPTEAPVVPQAWGTGQRVLLVDDDDINRKIVEAYLTGMGLKVEAARNGKEALEKFAYWKGVDFVIMDCEMPVMDGLEATQRLRALEREKGLGPALVLALSAHTDGEVMKRCLEVGMDDFLRKPVSRQRLSEVLRKGRGARV